MGKTSACINMMNRDTENRYLFVTPFKDETDRIIKACKARGFVKPQEQVKWSSYKKLDSLNDLLREKKNIATTHALFFNYTEETKQLIRDGDYVLVFDEVIDPLQQVSKEEINLADLELIMRKGVFDVSDDEYFFNEDDYEKSGGKLLRNINRGLKSKKLIKGDDSVALWGLSDDIFNCFKDGYLLTYMFEFQPMRQYFDLCKIDYQFIGVKKENENYEFCALEEMDRRIDLTNKIHICDDKKLNKIGEGYNSLSLNWFNKSGGKNQKILKNNTYNYFRNKLNGVAKDRMWTSYKSLKEDIKGNGYAKEFVVFNIRATNKFDHKKHIVYGVNLFLQPWKKKYFKKHGAREINEDMWALSHCLQFLFRSRLRKGKEVWIYIPSQRMRELLKQWLINLKAGEDLKEIILDRGVIK